MVAFKELRVFQVKNGIAVRAQSAIGQYKDEWVFSDIEELKTFIGDNFLDAAAIKKLNIPEHTEK